jgi:hypothetical protein
MAPRSGSADIPNHRGRVNRGPGDLPLVAPRANCQYRFRFQLFRAFSRWKHLSIASSNRSSMSNSSCMRCAVPRSPVVRSKASPFLSCFFVCGLNRRRVGCNQFLTSYLIRFTPWLPKSRKRRQQVELGQISPSLFSFDNLAPPFLRPHRPTKGRKISLAPEKPCQACNSVRFEWPLGRELDDEISAQFIEVCGTFAREKLHRRMVLIVDRIVLLACANLCRHLILP